MPAHESYRAVTTSIVRDTLTAGRKAVFDLSSSLCGMLRRRRPVCSSAPRARPAPGGPIGRGVLGAPATVARQPRPVVRRVAGTAGGRRRSREVTVAVARSVAPCRPARSARPEGWRGHAGPPAARLAAVSPAADADGAPADTRAEAGHRGRRVAQRSAPKRSSTSAPMPPPTRQ